MVIKYEVDPDHKLRDAIQEALTKVKDLTIPFGLISAQWFKSNQAIFALTGPGKYADLKETYKKQKSRKWGFIYPILKARGDLAESITDPKSGSAVSEVLNKTQLILGTRVSYARYLHDGTKFMPSRPVVLYGAEQVAPSALNKRRDIWIRTIADYVLQASAGIGEQV